uniref:Uncharacterized protein n=1 Tax=Tanacetum cinerariifolium TaxID=118510 RepID=A0A699GU79_TANCI|nr:hypothetical protein [Tanacetum cinerariifolium]
MQNLERSCAILPNCRNLEVVRNNIKAVKNVIKNEPHLISEIVNNNLCSLAIFTKHSCVSKEKRLFGPNGGKGGKEEVSFDTFGEGRDEIGNYGGNGGRGSSIFERGGGVLAIHSMKSKDGLRGEGLVVIGESWVRAGGGEVKGGGVDFGVILLGEILERVRVRVVVKSL